MDNRIALSSITLNAGAEPTGDRSDLRRRNTKHPSIARNVPSFKSSAEVIFELKLPPEHALGFPIS